MNDERMAQQIRDNKDKIIAAIANEDVIITGLLAASKYVDGKHKICYCAEGIVLRELGYSLVDGVNLGDAARESMEQFGFDTNYAMALFDGDNNMIIEFFNVVVECMPGLGGDDIQQFCQDNQGKPGIDMLNEHVEENTLIYEDNLIHGDSKRVQSSFNLFEINDVCYDHSNDHPLSPKLFSELIAYCWRNI